MHKTTAILCLTTLLVMTSYVGAQDSELKDTTKSKYKVGQVWSYKTRPQEAKSTLIIVKVESHPKFGNIIHIALTGLRVSKPNGSFILMANHLPFSEEAISRSVVKLVKESSDLPNYDEGYQLWREAFAAGTAGFYMTSVAEAVGIMEETLNP